MQNLTLIFFFMIILMGSHLGDYCVKFKKSQLNNSSEYLGDVRLKDETTLPYQVKYSYEIWWGNVKF